MQLAAISSPASNSFRSIAEAVPGVEWDLTERTEFLIFINNFN